MLVSTQTRGIVLRLFGWLAAATLLAVIAMASMPQKAVLFALAVTSMAAIVAFKRPMWIVYFVTALVPLEAFLIKFLPGPDQIVLAAQFVGEAAIAGTLLLALTRRLLGRGTLRTTPLDLPLLILLSATVMSLLLNETGTTGLLGGALNMRVLFRYVGLFYLVVNLEPRPRQVRTIVRIVLVLGAINVVIGLLQWSVGEPFRTLFLPASIDADFLGQTRSSLLITRGREIGAVFGTAGDTLFYGLFMVIVTTVFLGMVRRLSLATLFGLGALLLAVSLSFARAAVLAWFLVGLIFYRWRYGVANTLLVALFGTVVVVLLLLPTTDQNDEFVNPRRSEQSIVRNLTSIFSQSYLARARNQRLGHMIGTIPTILANRPLLGYGPNQDTTIAAINASSPSFLLFEVRPNGFEDVYWMALLAYYGLFGTAAFGAVLVVLYRTARRIFLRSEQRMTRNMAVTVACLTAATIVLMLIYRVPEFRIYSFYLWLLPALLFSLDSQERSVAIHEEAIV